MDYFAHIWHWQWAFYILSCNIRRHIIIKCTANIYCTAINQKVIEIKARVDNRLAHWVDTFYNLLD